jgi:hypothetical protein
MLATLPASDPLAKEIRKLDTDLEAGIEFEEFHARREQLLMAARRRVC